MKREEELEKDWHREYLRKEKTSIPSKGKDYETASSSINQGFQGINSGNDHSPSELIFTNYHCCHQSPSHVSYYRGQDASKIMQPDNCHMNARNDQNHEHHWSALQIQQWNEETNQGYAIADEENLLKINDALLTDELAEMIVKGQIERVTPQVFDRFFMDEGTLRNVVFELMEHIQLDQWIAVLRDTSLEPIPPLVLNAIFHEFI